MTPDFDPYHKWLGIPPHEQPANHYRLLGISLFETDPDVIEHAADRQMSHLRTHTNGPNAPHSQKLLNEISAAKLCLLNPAKRGDYDVQLRLQQAPPPSVAPQPIYAQPAAQYVAAPAPVYAPQYPAAQYPPQQPYAAQPTYAAAQQYAQPTYPPVAAAAAYEQPAEEPEESYAAEDHGVSVNTRRGRSRRVSDLPMWAKLGGQIVASVLGLGGGYAFLCWLGPQYDFLGVMSRPTEVASSSTTGESGKAASSQNEGGSSKSTKSSKPTNDNAGRTSNSPKTKKPAELDLLTLIDSKRDSVRGDWRMDNGVLLSPAHLTQARLNLPIPSPLPESYELTLVVVRQANTGPWQALITGLVLWGEERQVFIDQQGKFSGLDRVDGKTFRENRTSVEKPQMKDGVPARVKCTVSPGDVLVEVDGREVLHWTGTAAELGIQQAASTANGLSKIYVGSDVTYRFTQITFKALEQKSRPKTPSPAATAASTAGAIDLLKLSDPKRDSVRGEWKLSGGVLDSPRSQKQARMEFQAPAQVPAEYELTVVATRQPTSGAAKGMAIGLVSEDKQFLVMLDAAGQDSGVENADGKSFQVNSTAHHGPIFKNGVPATVQCTVNQRRVRVTVAGKPIIDWSGELGSLGVPEDWKTPHSDRLFIGTDSTYRISQVTLRPLTSQSTQSVASTVPSTPIKKPVPSPGSVKKRPPPRTLGDLLEPKAKKAAPEVADRKAAEKQLRDEFKDDFTKAKKDFAEQAKLAKKLRDRVAGSSAKPAELYAGLELAIELAGSAGDLRVGAEAVNELGSQFKGVDVLTRQEDLMKDAVKRTKTTDDLKTVAEAYRLLLNRAIVEDRYEMAVKFGTKAQDFARRSKDEVLVKLLAEGVKELRVMQAAYDEVRAARDKLEQSTDDAAACGQWGRFLCVYKNDWDNGRTLWCQTASSDPLAALAGDDLDGPKSAADQAALADRWWQAADDEQQSLPQRLLRERANYWYRLALPSLSASEKARVESRLKEHDEANSAFPRGKWVDVLKLVDLNRHKSAGNWLRRGDEIGIKDSPDNGRFTVPVAPKGAYDFDVQFTIVKNHDVIVMLPVGDHQCVVLLNGWEGTVSGIGDWLGYREIRENPTAFKHKRLAVNQRHRLQMSVESQGDKVDIKVTLDDQSWLKYSGPTSALKLHDFWKLNGPNVLGLGTYRADMVFHSARLRINSGSARLVTD